MADLAGIAHMSEFHFSRLFKQSTGYAPYRYVMGRRVQRGRELLAKTALPLHEISEKLGFGDQSHFTTVFKKNVGMTPKQFRDLSRQ
jgi:AraC family transcriptional regulator